MPRSSVAKAPVGASATLTLNAPPPAAPPADEESTKPDFWDYIQQLSPEQWNEHIVYITRENPSTSINGVGGYLVKLTQAFDKEDIKTAYGGYEFSYILKHKNDICRNCRNAKGRFRVEAPPRYDMSREIPGTTAASSNGNGDLAAFQKEFISVLREELARSREANKGGMPGVDKVVEMMSTASDKAMEIVTKQTPTATTPLSQLSELITIVKGLMPQQQPGSSVVETIKVLKELGLIGQAADPTAQLNTFLSIFEKIDALRGTGDRGKSDYKTVLAEKGIDAAEHLATVLFENRKSQLALAREQRARSEAIARQADAIREVNTRAATPAPANPAPAPTAPARSATTIPTPIRMVPRNGEPSANETAAPAPSSASEEVRANADEYLKGVKVRFVELLAAGEDSEFIVDFLEASRPDFIPYLTNYSPEQVTAYMRDDPILSHAVALPRWNDWLEDARAYLTEEPEETGKPN